MLTRFITKEASILFAALTLIILSLIGNSSFVRESFFIETALFFIVFTVIVLAAMGVVQHAEQLAYKFGEPYGTMILTFAAVAVEIIMITTMMLHGDADPTLARDTVFSTFMILLNALIGLIMLLGGFKYGEQKYNLKSSNSFFSMIFAIVGLGMFLPLIVDGKNYHLYEFFLIIICLALYAFFIRMQSKEHNYYFRFEGNKKEFSHEQPVNKNINAFYHTIMLIAAIALISVLAESLSVFVDDEIERFGLPTAIAGLIVAIIIVSPEGLTAIRAGLNDEMQRVINISLGSMLSTAALTIPAVLIVGLIIKQDINLGLTPVQGALLIISFLVGILSVKDGETNALQGFIHIILFVTFVFLIFL